MAAYPTFGQEISSSEEIKDDVQVDRASNGKIRLRGFYPAPKSNFTISHMVPQSTKILLVGMVPIATTILTTSGTTATATVASAHGATVGSVVYISNTTASGAPTNGYNGGFTVLSTPTTASFTFDNSTAVGTQAGAGTISLSHYEGNRTNSFTFIWKQDSSTHTCYYSAAPKIQNLGGLYYMVTNSLSEA